MFGFLYKLDTMTNARNKNNNMAQHKLIVLIILSHLLLKILENIKYIPIPTIPPNVFIMRSVISLAPTAKIN